jgi:xylulokinase
LRAAGSEVNRVMAVGGGTRSALWLKIIATVLGLPVDVPTDGDFGGAFGAARLGLIAATKADFRQVLKPPKTAKTVMPDKKAIAAYQDAYAAYAQIYPATRELNRQ